VEHVSSLDGAVDAFPLGSAVCLTFIQLDE